MVVSHMKHWYHSTDTNAPLAIKQVVFVMFSGARSGGDALSFWNLTFLTEYFR